MPTKLQRVLGAAERFKVRHAMLIPSIKSTDTGLLPCENRLELVRDCQSFIGIGHRANFVDHE